MDLANRAMSKIIGNKALKSQLCQEILSGSLHHAYILEGPSGSGKHTIALMAAAALACENKNDVSKPIPCLSCPSCKKILERKSPDVIFQGTEGKATIGVDIARFLKEDVHIIPNDLDHKIYIIEDADKLGLAQLHQLRGRVGRSARRASAYLTYKRDKNLSEIAYKRLQAIREYTEFGSGFKIAMRDLEIRGAGNLLGAQQHGHLASVGYDMYMKLLGEAISQQKGEKPKEKECLIDLQINAHIPEKYISALQQRLSIYRRIADIRSFQDAEDVRDELRDRYGDIPPSVEGLIEVSLCRNTAASLGIYEIGQRGDILYLYCEEINTALVLNISSVLRGRVGLTKTGKKSINIKKKDGQDSLDTLKEIFQAVESTRINK